jgi:hypothetical protein
MKVETKEKLFKVAKISGIVVLGAAALAGVFFGARFFLKGKSSGDCGGDCECSGSDSGGDSQ